MRLTYHPYTLELRRTFTLATGSRTSTPAMLVEVEQDGIIGYGEASMPPYLGESQATAEAFLARVELSQADPFRWDKILDAVDHLAPGNHAAKAAVDIALHDWVGKKLGLPWHRIWGLDPEKAPVSSMTITIDTPDNIRARVKGAEGFPVLKIKLGSERDKEIVQTVREVTDVPLRVDVNQGWADREEALRMVEWLATQGVELVEQPMPKERLEDHAWLTTRSPLPIVADESVVRLSDIRKLRGAFHGINVKLMKCTGMREAYRMILLAHDLGMKVMLGCMTETSCAISAAAQLAPLVEWADLDGALLIANDPFRGATVHDGKITLPQDAGIGVERILDQ
ncbi:MAG: L-Ala-D/L-Glu epimerase [Bacteroidetes bacterium]|nr:L-Ala-D/L-Glu epimerase [Bacteroidota bacterium]